jgi:hypothetical protein
MNPNDIPAALRAPFAPEDVKFKPAAVSGNRALAVAYVDARTIMDRLDEVLGVDGWQDSYEQLPDGNVVCRLRCKIGEQWITKVDVGGPSEQPDDGDKLKAAFSDALKRAAVKFGVGRYLYHVPHQWCDYDPKKRQFVQPPSLPAWAAAAPPARLSARLTADQLAEWEATIRSVEGLTGLNALLPRIAALAHREDRVKVFGAAQRCAQTAQARWNDQAKQFVAMNHHA